MSVVLFLLFIWVYGKWRECHVDMETEGQVAEKPWIDGFVVGVVDGEVGGGIT